MRIGLTAVILADQAAFLSRWAGYLAGRMGVVVSFAARDSYQEILDMLFSGQIDAAWICGYPYVQHQARLQLVAVPIYKTKPLYRAYLIRPAGYGDKVKGWGDLRQRVLAYSDPLSNSGWLVPQAKMRDAGIHARDLRRTFFAHGHRNVAEAVSARLAEAGCIDGYVWETMRRQRMPAAMDTEVVWESDLYGFPPLVVRVATPADTLQQLRASLFGMAEDTEGRVLLQALNLDGFSLEPASIFESIARLAQAQERAT